MAHTLSIWRLSDGRRGHDNQSLGLVDALSRITRVASRDVPVRGTFFTAARMLRSAVSRPALVLGAGHGTHVSLLAAALRHGARSVVLMNPSLPRSLFDLCIIPQHDGVPEGGNVMLSLGALNRVLPSVRRGSREGLMLIGGPSRHHQWDETSLVKQVCEVVKAAPYLAWQATGSPRTPASTLEALKQVPALEVIDFAATSAEWLPTRLEQAAQVWVTQDSVSMAYEAVSSGAPTGILSVPARRRSRVHAALEALVDARLVTPFASWRTGQGLTAPEPLQEADRCARRILERWPDLA